MRYGLIVTGILLLVSGLLWPRIERLGLGRLPGDLSIHRPGFVFYFPVTTSIIVSIVLSAIIWLMRR